MKTAIHVVNRCFDELQCASALRHSAMPDDTPLPFDLPSVCRKKLTVDFSGGNQSSDGGLLLRENERTLGVCRRLAGAMPDRCDADRIRHAMFEIVMARVAAIACGYAIDPAVAAALRCYNRSRVDKNVEKKQNKQ